MHFIALGIYSFIISISRLSLLNSHESQTAPPVRTCTSSKIRCMFNVTGEPRQHFSELSGARPYSKICRYNGRLYQLGWQIRPTGSACKVCACNELWDDRDPLGSLACADIVCPDSLAVKLGEGCLPVYAQGVCCPIDYHCRQQCVYNGSRFAIGSQLFLRYNEFVCDECRCSAPPTFTCEQRTCPPL